MRFPDVALHEKLIGEKKEGGNVVHSPHHLLEVNSQINTGSGSFLIVRDLNKFYRKKIMVAEKVFVNCYNFNPTGVT
jgi:hypothetical protein